MIKSFSREPKKERGFRARSKTASFIDLERAERLREVFEALNEVNKKVPVIVEGKRDSEALRRLGLAGEIIILHRGNNIYEFCEEVAERFERVVLLLDWDERGESLYRSLSSHLKGHWEEFGNFREILKILCQKEIKDIEGIPSLLRNLEGEEGPR
jgi:5S rRNA maturation endonuclease (ribonuclease M5)